MSRVIAIPFRKRPPRGWCGPLREMFPGVKIVASQPINSTGVKGPDQLVWHVNNPDLTNAERVAYYDNNIAAPLMAAAVALGDHVLFAHDSVVIEQVKANSLWSMLEKMPSMQFTSAQPIMFNDGINPPSVLDYTDRFVAFRGETAMEWFTTFPVDPQGRATMGIIMQRIVDAGLQPGMSYYWDMKMTVTEV